METQNHNINTEEIYKCSKCGLCQKFCPVYNATKNEKVLPRGRYIILNSFAQNNKQLSTDFIKSLDVCLTCNLCKNFCPSSIDYNKILSDTKKEYKLFDFSKKYKKILYTNNLAKILYKFFPLKSIFLNTWIDKLYSIKVKRKKTKQTQTKGNIVYFQGCFNKYINPSDKNATLNIIEELGYNTIQINNNCCGYPLLCDENIEKFNTNAERITKSIPENVKYIVCSCSTCYETLNKIEQLKDKLITIEELLKIENKDIPANENLIPYNINYSLMNNLFMLKQPKIAKQIAKGFNFEDKNVITSCLLTKWSLIKHNIQTYSISEATSLLEKK